MGKKITLNDVRIEIERRGGTLISTEYIDSHEQLDVQCGICGLIWHPCFSSIKYNGSWCPQCAGTFKYTDEYVKQTIEQKGGKLLSEYTGVKNRLDVECGDCGRVWHPTFSKILKGRWCHYCAGNKKFDIQFVKDAIANRDGYLASEYRNSTSKIDVLCNICGEIWHPTLGKILRGSWCPKCKNNRTEVRLYFILEQIFPNKVICYKHNEFDWLAGKSGHKQHLDIFIPDLKLAIEYNGEQHYRPVRFGGKKMSEQQAQEIFRYTQEMDAAKRLKIAAHPEDIALLIDIPYSESIEINNVVRILSENNVYVDLNGIDYTKKPNRERLDIALQERKKIRRKEALRKYADKSKKERKKNDIPR